MVVAERDGFDNEVIFDDRLVELRRAARWRELSDALVPY